MNLMNRGRLMLLTSLAIIVAAGNLHAHFIWVAKSPDTGKIQIFFGEGPQPDQAQFLAGIASANVWAIDTGFSASELTLETKTDEDKGWFECVSDTAMGAVDCNCSYGTFTRGEKTMFLHYCAKYRRHLSGTVSRCSGKLPLDIAVDTTSDNPTFTIVHNGTPVAGCEVIIIDAAGTETKLNSGDDGTVSADIAGPGRYLVRAKHVDENPGTHEGTGYELKNYYCTLTLDHAIQETVTVNPPAAIADVPVGITSFGGATLNNHVYVYGGHCGEAHEYYAEGQNKTLYSIDLNNPEQWNAVGEGPGLQGLAMVAHGDKLYRLGGFNAKNEEGDDQDLHSVNEFAVFDFETKEWTQLAPMPYARSSFDAVVVGDAIYVVGGWQMQGDDDSLWHQTALKIDLTEDQPAWVELPAPPFKRRANSVGFRGNTLYVVGGMQETGGPTRAVATYDLENNSWNEGPEIPGEEAMEGFGSSCFNVNGELVVSTYGGLVYKLNETGDGWDQIHELDEGRFFHRLLPVSDSHFALIGGANMETGKSMEVEVLSVNE